MDFDPSTVVFAGVPLLIFIIGAIELVKPYFPNVPGAVWLLASFCLGIVGQALVYVNANGAPTEANAWVYLITTGVLTGAAAAKAYDETIKPARARAEDEVRTETAVAMAAGQPVVMYLRENAGGGVPIGSGAVVMLNGTEFMLVPVTAAPPGLVGGGSFTSQDLAGWRVENAFGAVGAEPDNPVSIHPGELSGGEADVTHGLDEGGGPDVPDAIDVPSLDLDEPVPGEGGA